MKVAIIVSIVTVYSSILFGQSLSPVSKSKSEHYISVRVRTWGNHKMKEENLSLNGLSIIRDNRAKIERLALDFTYALKFKGQYWAVARAGIEHQYRSTSRQYASFNGSSISSAENIEQEVKSQFFWLSLGIQKTIFEKNQLLFRVGADLPIAYRPRNRMIATNNVFDEQQRIRGTLESIIDRAASLRVSLALNNNLYYFISDHFSIGIEIEGIVSYQWENGTYYERPALYDANGSKIASLNIPHDMKTSRISKNLFLSVAVQYSW